MPEAAHACPHAPMRACTQALFHACAGTHAPSTRTCSPIAFAMSSFFLRNCTMRLTCDKGGRGKSYSNNFGRPATTPMILFEMKRRIPWSSAASPCRQTLPVQQHADSMLLGSHELAARLPCRQHTQQNVPPGSGQGQGCAPHRRHCSRWARSAPTAAARHKRTRSGSNPA